MTKRSSPGRRSGSHRQAVRVLQIVDDLRERRTPRLLRELAEAHRVDERTIRRDLEALEGAGYELAFELVDGRSAVRLARTAPTRVTLTVGERFALVAAHRVFAAFEGTDLARWIDSAVAKLAASLGPSSERKLAGISRRLAYVPDGGVKVAAGKDDVVDAFVSAILHSNGVRAAYTSRDGRKRSGNFEPYGFAIYRHGLYVVGRWKTATHVRVYAIERFSSASRVRAAIAVPEDFDVRQFFSGAFGVWVSEPATSVVLDFHPDVADVLAKRVYHESQTVEVLPSGVTRVTLAIGATPDLVSWVLSWGTCVYVRSPDELRARVESEHELSMERPDWAAENDARPRAVETGRARGRSRGNRVATRPSK